MEDEKKTGYADDFPSSANEPVFEALPDYRLATDEQPLFETGENKLSTASPEELLFEETTLDEKTLTELEAFIARARALKGATAPPEGFRPTSPTPKYNKPKPEASPQTKRSASLRRPTPKTHNIPFEVDYGAGRIETTNEHATPAASSPPTSTPLTTGPNSPSGKPSFEFMFAPSGKTEPAVPSPTPPQLHQTQEQVPVAQAKQPVSTTTNDDPKTDAQKRKTKDCPDCLTELPAAARFCFSCGYPQPEEEVFSPTGAKAPEEDFLVLEELPAEPVIATTKTAVPKTAPNTEEANPLSSTASAKSPKTTSGAISTRKYTMAELKQAFREYFQERVIAYFGAPKLKKYYTALEESNSFQQLRDGSLTNLLNWINGGERTYASVARRINDTMADLTEYFIVEIAGELSGNVLPQRLLRHQSANWETVDLFKLVMDFLDFEAETERVYTDFVAMPARALRNATKAFLRAGKDERIFFICDQSLISQAKNGFAVTDAGIYWKNVLQPAGSALYTTMEQVSIRQGHLEVDGQFFNAGARLNLKMAVLLDKLRRMG